MKREPTTVELNSQKRIKQLIDTRCGGSQQIFADRVGIGKSSVSQYVNGTNFPTNVRAKQIADVFGVSPLWIMGFDVPMIDMSKVEKDGAHYVGISRILNENSAQTTSTTESEEHLQLAPYIAFIKYPIIQRLLDAADECNEDQINLAIDMLNQFKAYNIRSQYNKQKENDNRPILPRLSRAEMGKLDALQEAEYWKHDSNNPDRYF